MAAIPNLGAMARVGYVLAGVALAWWGLFSADAAWARILCAVLGGVLVVEGVIGC